MHVIDIFSKKLACPSKLGQLQETRLQTTFMQLRYIVMTFPETYQQDNKKRLQINSLYIRCQRVGVNSSSPVL